MAPAAAGLFFAMVWSAIARYVFWHTWTRKDGVRLPHLYIYTRETAAFGCFSLAPSMEKKFRAPWVPICLKCHLIAIKLHLNIAKFIVSVSYILWEGGFLYRLCFVQGGLMLFISKTAWISISRHVWIREVNCVDVQTLNFL